ncbi:hypothetical protein CkaCkLH20_12164 [Colletotrichum karsti]|uniref:Tyrosine specific protein phosphatases domain-containing protein n=1 Tax=Colletotrichum karsti TaxID=1095194 RepID=A0A9P6LFG7_9PEZI|nr:uncharacterized protein CkaCkLH20_12164 [Colletotrichum karsti]KAF9870317.1 hypothetical protein CkaCkLH20_12164 [Colletotrichum karsti]
MTEGVSSAVRAAPYSHRPPSPPYIPIPMTLPRSNESASLKPSYDNVDSMRLTSEDLGIITRNVKQAITDRSTNWNYKARRKAQPILDFLYLGPLSVARDAEWLAKEGITMIIAARHSRVAQARLMSVDNVARQLGILVEYLDVSDNGELIRNFPEVVRKINDHLLQVYRSQALAMQQGQIVIDAANFKPGKVLIVCETGNDRSAFVVAAYVMTVYGKDMVSSVQFVSLQRFSVNFDEDGKRMLQAYEDILSAQKHVSYATRDVPRAGQLDGRTGGGKRRIEATLDEDDRQEGDGYDAFVVDRARYEDRAKFVPFIDGGETLQDEDDDNDDEYEKSGNRDEYGEAESDPGVSGRRLRRSTLSHQPGRYAEMLVAGVEKPAFTLPDPIFDPEPSRHCAFPTIELDEYPGPSELFLEARARGETGTGAHMHRQSPFAEDGLRDEQGARPALVAHLPPYESQAIDDDEEDGDPFIEDNHQSSSPPRDLIRGESFKDFNLAVTQGLDWGSPEPEPEPEPEPQLPGIYGFDRENIFHPEVEAPPDDWSKIGVGVQWVIIATLCQAYPFSVAVQKLQLTTRQITTFVQTYIRCNEKIIEWCDKIDRTPVSDLIRSAEERSMSVDYYMQLARPELPTDIMFRFQLEQARGFLRKIRHGALVEILGRWRGTSTSFVELPIHPDILDTCRSMLYRERPINLQDFRPIKERLPTPWLERLHDTTDFHNGLAHFHDYYMGPYAANPFADPFALDPNVVDTTDPQNVTQPEASSSDPSMGSTQESNEIPSRPKTSQLGQSGRAQSHASSWNADEANSFQLDQQPAPELQFTYNQASVQDPHVAESLRKNPFKRPADHHKNGTDHPDPFPTSDDPLQPANEMGPSQVASMMISRQQRKDTPRPGRSLQGPAKHGAPKVKFQGFARTVSSHGPKPFKDSASGLGSYMSLNANRGSASYTSPYLFNTPPKESVHSAQLEPRFELKMPEAARPSAEQCSFGENVPGGNGRGTEHGMDSFVNDIVTEGSNEVLPAQPQDSVPTQRSRKRAAEDSEEEYYEQDDDKDDDWVQPRKRPRKSNATEPSTRNNKKTGAAKSKATKNKKKAPEIGPDGQPIKRPRGRPRKHPRPEDVRNQSSSNVGLAGVAATGLESSSKKAASERQDSSQSLANDVHQTAESTGTEASGTHASSMSESLAPTTKAHETKKKTPIKLKLLNSNRQSSTARAPTTTAEASYDRQSHSQLAGSGLAPWQSSNSPPQFGENLASTAGGFQMPTETRAPGEVRQNQSISQTEASTYSHSRNTQYANYQEFWNDYENGKKMFHEAAMRGLMADRMMMRHNAHHAHHAHRAATTSITNVQSKPQMSSAPTTSAGKKTQKPPTRAQRAAQVSRMSGPQIRQAPPQEHAQSWAESLVLRAPVTAVTGRQSQQAVSQDPNQSSAETSMLGAPVAPSSSPQSQQARPQGPTYSLAETTVLRTPATTGPCPQGQQTPAQAHVQLSDEAPAQDPTHCWVETGMHETPITTGFSLQSQQAPTQGFAQVPAEVPAETPIQDLARDPTPLWAKTFVFDNRVNVGPEAASPANTVGWSEYGSTSTQPPHAPDATEQQTIDPNASLASDIDPELMGRMMWLRDTLANED